MGRITETQIAVALVTMVTVKVGDKEIPATLMHGRRKVKLI